MYLILLYEKYIIHKNIIRNIICVIFFTFYILENGSFFQS